MDKPAEPIAVVVRLVVRSGVNSCGICCRGPKQTMAKFLVAVRVGSVVPPRNENVDGSTSTGGSIEPGMPATNRVSVGSAS